MFKLYNVGKTFIRLNLRKAHFSALVEYSKRNLSSQELFNEGSYDYKKWISQFTDISHIMESKYIQQVVFVNCKLERIIYYESYLMDELLTLLLSRGLIPADAVYIATADEIILYADKVSDKEALPLFIRNYDLPISFEEFSLAKVTGTGAYLKEVADYLDFIGSFTVAEIKFATPEETVLIQRLLNGQEITEHDLVFDYNGKLARLLDIPEFEIVRSFEQKA